MEKKEQYALIFRALADENRIRILELIGREEKNAGELLEQLEVVQSTLSHHMKVLTESGLVSARKSGKWTYYAICGEVLEEAGQYLFHMKGAAGDTALRPAEGTEKTSENRRENLQESEKKLRRARHQPYPTGNLSRKQQIRLPRIWRRKSSTQRRMSRPGGQSSRMKRRPARAPQ